MFPSSGLFADIQCPFSKRGQCERPHCLYKHATEVPDSKSSIVCSAVPGLHNGYPSCEASVKQPGGECFQELERINKEIETVRHEVEQEQRRLSHYQTLQTDCKNSLLNFSKSKSEPAGKNMDFSKTLSQAKKYVIDNTKPRTDLEYDPLSNYSADLRSYSSSDREQKHIKKEQSLKRARNAAPCDQNKPPVQTLLPKPSSVEPLDDSNEDCVLIIDIPPSPIKKRGRNSGDARIGVECSPEPTSPSPTLDLQDHIWNGLVVEKQANTVELPQCELNHSVGKMNCFPQTNSLFYKSPDANSDSPCRQHNKPSPMEQSAQNRVHTMSPKQMTPSLGPGSQNALRKMPGHIEDKAVINPTSCVRYQEQVEPSVSFSLTNSPESESTDQLLVNADDKAVIMIKSSSEEELNYSDVDLSDSDPMEECYRIFMEANNETKGNEEQPNMSVVAVDVEKSEMDVKTQELQGKKRVAHEAKHTEQPVVKSRPQPQILVPLRGPATSGFGSQPAVTSKIMQVQQRATMLTAAVKGVQALVSSTFQRKPGTQNAPSTSTQTLENLQPAPLQNAYMNYIPLGTAVINMGNNLHLILPEGVYPVPIASSSSPVTPVLTPISQVHASSVAVKQTYCPPAVTPVQRYRSAAPVLIPAPAFRPSLTSGLALAQSNAAALTQSAVSTAVKPVPTKRKLRQQCEAAKDKVPHDVRQRYVNMFTKEFMKTTVNVNDAFEKALAEEKTVYNRSVNKLKYLSVAVNALKRLKNQSAVSAKGENPMNKQRSKGNKPLNLSNIQKNDDGAFYESLNDYILPEETLVESNYPVPHPEKPGSAALFADSKKGNADSLKRICCRCGATYSVSRTGKHIRKEECNYHYGKGVENRVPGGVETRYSCCEGVMGAAGCQVFKLHVHDSLSLDGFVSSVPRQPSDKSCPGVYSLDCEMCYTIQGLELSRVTVVNSSLQVIYDTFVKPANDVIDYNTRFTGISEDDVQNNHITLREVQHTLLSFISADTILIGHGLEADLCALKLLHSMVVDTSVVFPHRLGLPHKLTLNSLTAEYLRRIIQESVCGHDTAEDAAACMELMLWKVKEDGKLKK